MISEKKIRGLAENFVANSELFLVEVNVLDGNKIMILLDGDHGVTIAECVNMSRHIEGQLDRESEDFELEVSSYGLNNPLVLFRQYTKNVGRALEVKTKKGEKYTGVLTEAFEGSIVLLEEIRNKTGHKVLEEKKHTLAFDEIEEARVSVSFK